MLMPGACEEYGCVCELVYTNLRVLSQIKGDKNQNPETLFYCKTTFNYRVLARSFLAKPHSCTPSAPSSRSRHLTWGEPCEVP